MHQYILSITGLGYVGLPVACEFAKYFPVIGYDINQQRIQALQAGYDITGEVSSAQLKNPNLQFTCDINQLNQANIHIVAVPTPIDNAKQPDLTLLKNASNAVGSILKQGDIVVYESTVYPGVTEEICVPILTKASGLRYLEDFNVGYSPERINPGDKEHTLSKIMKVVSASKTETLAILTKVYGTVVTAGIHQASSIKVAEAAKVIENTQRDLNIAFMNELAIIFNKLNISTSEVLQAAKTKWNFMPFTPGLVGGHCISVDPYYLTHKAEQLGYHPEVILAGRRINDNMGKYIAEQTVLKIIQQGLSIQNANVCILGITFKENCPDIRNSKVIDIINALKNYNIIPQICDYLANKEEVYHEYLIKLANFNLDQQFDAIILAVPHKQYASLEPQKLKQILSPNGVIIDIKSIYRNEQFSNSKIHYWSL